MEGEREKKRTEVERQQIRVFMHYQHDLLEDFPVHFSSAIVMNVAVNHRGFSWDHPHLYSLATCLHVSLHVLRDLYWNIREKHSLIHKQVGFGDEFPESNY
jgi:hypothetical protein